MNIFINQITSFHKNEIEKIFESHHGGEEIVSSCCGQSVNQDSFKCLKPGTWLNDKVINYFLKVCLTKRDQMLCTAIPSRKRSFFFDTHFMDTLMKSGKYDYNEIKTWYKKAPEDSLFQLKYIFFPINKDNKHWILIVVFVEERTIQYYDSLGKTDKSMLSIILRYLKDEWKRTESENSVDWKSWKLQENCVYTPQQKNSKFIFLCGLL